VFGKGIGNRFFGSFSFKDNGFVGERSIGLWVINSDNLVIIGIHANLLDIWEWLSLEFLDNINDIFVITWSFGRGFFDDSLGSTSSSSVDGSKSFGEFLSVLKDLLFGWHTL
jgi:hypothetical protein